jgi:thymidylate synthase ThyX
MASYTQKSYRQVRDLANHPVWDNPFIVPPQLDVGDVLFWIRDMRTHISIYNRWLEKGYESDVARFHLPQGLATNIAITMNARSLRNMFGMRLERHAMFEFQQLCSLMLGLIKQEGLYFLFEDVVEEAL